MLQKYGNKILTLTVFFIIFSSSAYALSGIQEEALINISTGRNSSYEVLLSIFNDIDINRTLAYNTLYNRTIEMELNASSSESNIQNNITALNALIVNNSKEINKTRNMAITDNELDVILDKRLSYYIRNDTFYGWKEPFYSLENMTVKVANENDDRFARFKKDYLKKTDFEYNSTQMKNNLTAFMIYRTRDKTPYSIIFFLIGVIIVAFVILEKTGRINIKKYLMNISVFQKRNTETLEELISPGKVRERVQRIRALKAIVFGDAKLKKDDKIKLIEHINRSLITNANELKADMQTIKESGKLGVDFESNIEKGKL